MSGFQNQLPRKRLPESATECGRLNEHQQQKLVCERVSEPVQRIQDEQQDCIKQNARRDDTKKVSRAVWWSNGGCFYLVEQWLNVELKRQSGTHHLRESITTPAAAEPRWRSDLFEQREQCCYHRGW